MAVNVTAKRGRRCRDRSGGKARLRRAAVDPGHAAGTRWLGEAEAGAVPAAAQVRSGGDTLAQGCALVEVRHVVQALGPLVSQCSSTHEFSWRVVDHVEHVERRHRSRAPESAMARICRCRRRCRLSPTYTVLLASIGLQGPVPFGRRRRSRRGRWGVNELPVGVKQPIPTSNRGAVYVPAGKVLVIGGVRDDDDFEAVPTARNHR